MYIFLVTSFVAGLLTLSTTSLYSLGAFPRPSPYLISDPTRNLFVWVFTLLLRKDIYIAFVFPANHIFNQMVICGLWFLMQRTACHIQFFALSRWLPVTLPVDYYEFVRGIQWIIPYFPLPWETKHNEQIMVASSPYIGPHSFISKTHNNRMNPQTSTNPESVFGLPLTAMEYRLFFQVKRN